MSLPAIFGTTLATIPARVPYLNADPALMEHWRSVLTGVLGPVSESRPFRIGIAWQGQSRNAGDHWRSFPLAQAAHLAELPGVRLISLQVTTERSRFPRWAAGSRSSSYLDSAVATSAIPRHVIRLLDLVISPCTAVAHLAGGLGARVWVPLSYVGDWRWLAQPRGQPLVPVLRLFRQTKLGDWESVFRRMAQALAAELESRSRSRRSGGLNGSSIRNSAARSCH